MDNKTIEQLMKLGIGIILSPVAFIDKAKKSPLIESRELLTKAYQEGIYHITSEEASSKIMDSEYVKASGKIASYSNIKRSFFFAGIPSPDVVAMNLYLKEELTAVKIKLPYEKLAQFEYRSKNDQALMYKGNLTFDHNNAEIVKLRLIEKDGILSYQEVNELTKNNESKNNLDNIKKSLITRIRTYQKGTIKEAEIILERYKTMIKKINQNNEFINIEEEYKTKGI